MLQEFIAAFYFILFYFIIHVRTALTEIGRNFRPPDAFPGYKKMRLGPGVLGPGVSKIAIFCIPLLRLTVDGGVPLGRSP